MLSQNQIHAAVRWFDCDRVDEKTQAALMQGQWSGFIPVQGDACRAMGTVERTLPSIVRCDYCASTIAPGRCPNCGATQFSCI